MHTRNSFERIVLISVFIGVWLSAGAAYSQSGSNYAISWDVFDSGGGNDVSENYTLASSLGQLAGGTSTSPNYTNYAGFANNDGGSGIAAQYALTLVQRGTGGGAVTVDGVAVSAEFTAVYDTGAKLVLHAVANADADFSGWAGGECTGTGDCTVTVNQDTVITALFTLKSYTFTASVNEGGTIEPEGEVALNIGTAQTFTFTPQIGYYLSDLLVDGVSVGAVTTYTFENVTSNHTIRAVFAINTYTLTASAGAGGSITPGGTVTVNYGNDQAFTITPDAGYEIAEVLVDNAPVEALTTYTETEGDTTITKATLTFTHVTANHTVAATFSKLVAGGSFVRDDWRDAEKSLTNPDDDWLCWAAAASNILDWAGWNTPLFGSSQDTFAAFQNYWSNAGGLMEYGWHWWFDGTQPPDWPGWAQLNQGWSNTSSGGGGYWTDYNFFDYYAEDWAAWDADTNQWSDGAGLMSAIDEYLNNDYGVTLAVYTDSGSGHALTAWGYEYDEFSDYTGVYVTDSDDYQTALKLLPVTLDAEQGLWHLGADYNGWFIGGVEGLAMKPEIPLVPEPGTLLLLMFGLFGLFALKRNCRFTRK